MKHRGQRCEAGINHGSCFGRHVSHSWKEGICQLTWVIISTLFLLFSHQLRTIIPESVPLELWYRQLLSCSPPSSSPKAPQKELKTATRSDCWPVSCHKITNNSRIQGPLVADLFKANLICRQLLMEFCGKESKKGLKITHVKSPLPRQTWSVLSAKNEW